LLFVPAVAAYAGCHPDPVGWLAGLKLLYLFTAHNSFDSMFFDCARARVLLFDVDLPVTQGFQVVFHFQQQHEPAAIGKLNAILDKTTGSVIKKKPRFLGPDMAASIDIHLSRPMCLETSETSKVSAVAAQIRELTVIFAGTRSVSVAVWRKNHCHGADSRNSGVIRTYWGSSN
jgi:hypothetical protein